jgi:hypothetical protein
MLIRKQMIVMSGDTGLGVYDLPLTMMAWAKPFLSFAPQALSQSILPGWIFAGAVNVTEENSAAPATERQVLTEYSYGRQLGRIMDVLHDLIIKDWPDGKPRPDSVAEFGKLWDDVQKIKNRPAAGRVQRVEQAIRDLRELRRSDAPAFERLAGELRELLNSEQPAAIAPAS